MLGGAEPVRRLVDAFYDAMEADEPVLAALHRLDADGHIPRGFRDRFALFLIGWLGGPQEYIEQHGHPRLRMRHAHVPVDATMRAAWLRCMTTAMDRSQVSGRARSYLDQRFAEVAEFLRNVPE
jgi:hemoglobin